MPQSPSLPRSDTENVDPGLLRAVQGGIRQQALEQALYAAANPPATVVAEEESALTMHPLPKSLPPMRERVTRLLRSVGRRGLRLARPFALPFLHRFEWRVRTAVDKSDFAIATLESLQSLRRAAVDKSDFAIALESLQSLQRQEAEGRKVIDQIHVALAASSAMEKHLDARLAALDRNVSAIGSRLEVLVEFGSLLLQRCVLPLGQEFAIRTDAGYLLVPAEDVHLLLTMIETRGRMEPGTLQVMHTLLRDGDVMIDVGANIGTLAIPAARWVGGSGRILALEPTPRVAGLLRRSAEINNVAAWLQVEHYAAGEADGEATLHISTNTTHNSLLPAEGDHIQVTVRPLDSLLLPGSKVTLVKIDAEGAELRVWRGMQRIIADNPALAVIVEFGPAHLRHAGVSVARWLDELRGPGFTAWEIDEGDGTLRPLRETGLEEVSSLNLLLLREPPASRPGLRLA